jgi:hypothetical protein
MGKIIINSKFLVIVMFILTSCKKPKIYFNLSRQELIECSSYGLKNITIDNDSINKNGFAVEPTIELKWEGDTPSPSIISFNNLSNYTIISNEKKLNSLKLMNNTRYKISYHVVGKQDFDIIVKTDENGKIYKTTNENCN